MELKFESNTIYLDISNSGNLLTFDIDGYTLLEKYKENTNYHGEYQLILKKEVKALKELFDSISPMREVASSINKLITYVIGRPLNFKANSFYGSRMTIQGIDSIDGWESNYKKIKNDLFQLEHPEQDVTEIAVANMNHWSTTNDSPLHELILIYTNYHKLDELTKLLIRFHAKALIHDHDIKYLILGKALEIAKPLLPDKDYVKSFNSLPQEIREVFKTRSIKWLYDISNTRRETRHIIQKGAVNILHPEMSEEEYFDFMFLADTFINYLVRTKFGLEPIILKMK